MGDRDGVVVVPRPCPGLARLIEDNLPLVKHVMFQVSVRVEGRLEEVAAFEQVVVKAGKDGALVRVADVGRVELGAENYASRLRFGGVDDPGLESRSVGHVELRRPDRRVFPHDLGDGVHRLKHTLHATVAPDDDVYIGVQGNPDAQRVREDDGCFNRPLLVYVGGSGALTGYGGGLDRKRFLLALEEPPATEADRLF